MNLSTKFFLLLYCSFIVSVYGQEETAPADSIASPANAIFYFEFGLLAAPQALGENYIAKGYNLKSGVDFGITALTKYFTLHGNIIVHGSTITDNQIVGDINKTRFSRYSFGVGYPFKLNENFTLNPSINYGYLLLRHRKPETTDFKDDGNFIAIDLQLNYQLIEGISFYASITGYSDYLKVRTAPSIQNFYDQSGAIYPVLGVRFNTIARKRKPGEPGDGIFTRRDGL